MNKETLIDDLLNRKRELESQLKELNFKGYPEIKEISGKKYIYLRYKRNNRLTSKYAGMYSENFYNDLKALSHSVKELNNELRRTNTKLAKLGISISDIDPKVYLNLDFVRSNLNTIIYGQAIVEGVSATFLETEEILNRGSSKNVSFDDTLTILNLKNAWQYILDEDTLRRGANFGVLSSIAEFVNDRQISYPGEIRTTKVLIGGSTYKPPIPNKEQVEETIFSILTSKKEPLFRAIDLLCYLVKAQVFNNGNKRTSLIFANLYLILNGLGFIYIPFNLDKKYKSLLVDYYEDKNEDVKDFLLNECYEKLM